MTRTANAGLAMTAAFVVLLVVALLVLVDFDRAGLFGIGIGAGLGIANLVLGSWVTLRALKRGLKSAMRILLGGFFLRLLAVTALILAFQRTAAVDVVAFALTFMVFFFLYLGVEVFLVERSLNGSRRGSGRPA